MAIYLLRRLLQAIPTIIGITIISFAIVRLAPGDPVMLMTFDPNMTRDARETLRHQLCLDRSIPEQYFIWIFGKEDCNTRGLIRGDFGNSLYEKRPVLDMIVERIPATLELGATAMIIGGTIGIVVGMYSAVKHGGLFDNLSRVFAVMFDAVPGFWLGLIMILVFSVILKWLPVGGRYTLSLEGEKDFIDHIKHMIMPAFILGVSWIAVISRYTRTQTLEVINQEYIRTARSKGLGEREVYFIHALRNALIPIATILGPAIGGLLGGAVITERIFSWPGMGRLAINAVFARDFPLILASVIIGSVLVVLGNLLSDVLYVIIDPRINLE